MAAYSEQFEAALTLAARAHGAQVRKGTDVPYIVHLIHVATILLRYRFAEDVVIAGLLHDIVEDQGVPLVQIEAQFGGAVAEMVGALTEWKRENDRDRRWENRKQELLDQVRQASHDAAAVKAADSLHNARTLVSALRQEGSQIWSRFSRGPEQSLWYYRAVADLVRQRLGTHTLAEELEAAVRALEQAIADTGSD